MLFLFLLLCPNLGLQPSVLPDTEDSRGSDPAASNGGAGPAVAMIERGAPRRAPLRPQAGLTSSGVAKMLQAAALSAKAAVRCPHLEEAVEEAVEEVMEEVADV